MTNFEMEMLAGASLDELLELAGVSKEEFEEVFKPLQTLQKILDRPKNR